MKSQLFTQGGAAIRSQLKKEEARYLLELDRGADAAILQAIRERMVGLQTRLTRTVDEYKVGSDYRDR